MFKEKKNKTSTKADPAFASSSLYFLASRLSNLLQFTSFEIYGYEIHGIWFSKGCCNWKGATSVFMAH